MYQLTTDMYDDLAHVGQVAMSRLPDGRLEIAVMDGPSTVATAMLNQRRAILPEREAERIRRWLNGDEP